MRAIIIAGGVSKRLRPLTEHIPKTLLKLDQKIILEHILDASRQAGITQFTILTGHGQEYVEGFAKLYARHYPNITMDFVHIPRYSETGNIIALQAAHHLFDQDAVIINSDTIFHPDVMRKLLQSAENNAMMIDDVKDLGEEEMKVFIDEGAYITQIHKSLDPGAADGEYVGVLKFGADAQDMMMQAVNALMEEDESVYYEDGIQKMIDEHNFKIKKISTEGLPVMEIDTHEDLEDAKNLIQKIQS